MLGDSTFWFAVFVGSRWAIRVIMLVTVSYRRAPATAKSWLLLILFEPWLGMILFFLFGQAKVPRRRRRKLVRAPRAFAAVIDRLSKSPNVFHPQVDPELRAAVTLAERLGQMPILGGNAVEVLPGYDNILDRIIADIDAAKDHVHLMFYIFADDPTARRVEEALGRAVRRGVTCRVIVDALGCRPFFRCVAPRLRKAGVHTCAALPVGAWRRLNRAHLRNHRKVVVIDGQIAYTGSQNLMQAEYKPGVVYEELMVRLTGPVVSELQFVFAIDWFLETDEVLDSPEVFPEPQITGRTPAQALTSGSAFPGQNMQQLVVALVHGARERIVITTPYFIPDEPLLDALATAVVRGVEVHLIVSLAADQLIVALAQQSYYGQLLQAGVRVHRYRRHFLHTKMLTIDGELTLTGSGNMDTRSLALNEEVSVLLYDREVTARARAEEERYLADAEEMALARWQRRPLIFKVFQRLARLLSPLL